MFLTGFCFLPFKLSLYWIVTNQNVILHIIFSVESKSKFYSKASLYFPRWNTPSAAGLIRLSLSIIFCYMPCTKGASNSFNSYYGGRCESLKASQQSESSGSPIRAGCIGDRDLLTLCRRCSASWERGEWGAENLFSSGLRCRKRKTRVLCPQAPSITYT
jgi:hypothetical protein